MMRRDEAEKREIDLLLNVTKQVQQVLDEQSARFPPGMTYQIPYSTTPFIWWNTLP